MTSASPFPVPRRPVRTGFARGILAFGLACSAAAFDVAAALEPRFGTGELPRPRPSAWLVFALQTAVWWAAALASAEAAAWCLGARP